MAGPGSILARAALLCVVGASAGLATNALRPAGVRLVGFEVKAMCGAETEGDAPATIEPAAASMLCGRPDVVIADARPADDYAVGHIAGAVHLPCTASSTSAADAMARFEGARTLIVYGQTTAEAMPVAASLRRRHRDVRVLAGGFPAWSQAGLACASGPCDSCEQAPPSPQSMK